jgi:hypothetical protein
MTLFARRFLLLAGLVLPRCDSPPGTALDAATDTPVDAVSQDGTDPALQLRPHAVNIVDAEAAREVREFMLGRGAVLPVGTRAFLARFEDRYDFLYIFTDGPVEGAAAAAKFSVARRPLIPGLGLSRAATEARYPQGRLRAVIGVVFNAVGNGPTLHETLHYWGMFLDPRFGFGRDRDTNFGAHWGLAAVAGQLGGFDGTTVRCVTPPTAMPPCAPDADGLLRLSAASFGPNANGGDGRPFAPLELYLMGLLPRAEVPSPITVWEGGHFVSRDMATGRMTFEVRSTRTVSLDEIVALHGERPPAPPEDRAFRGAFVAFSEAPLSSARMDALERWAAIFGGDETSRSIYSFARATGDRATMDTRLAPPR